MHTGSCELSPLLQWCSVLSAEPSGQSSSPARAEPVERPVKWVQQAQPHHSSWLAQTFSISFIFLLLSKGEPNPTDGRFSMWSLKETKPFLFKIHYKKTKLFWETQLSAAAPVGSTGDGYALEPQWASAAEGSGLHHLPSYRIFPQQGERLPSPAAVQDSRVRIWDRWLIAMRATR